MVLRFAGHFVKNFLWFLSFLSGTDKITRTKILVEINGLHLVHCNCIAGRILTGKKKELKPETEISSETLM